MTDCKIPQSSDLDEEYDALAIKLARHLKYKMLPRLLQYQQSIPSQTVLLIPENHMYHYKQLLMENKFLVDKALCYKLEGRGFDTR
jgi:hypothetical protein